MKNRTNFNRRVGIRLTDGQFYTLQNLSNFHNMTVADYVKKCCNLSNIPAQTEFMPIGSIDNYVLEDNTPDVVKRGDATLKEIHDTEYYNNLGHIYEDMKNEVNEHFNSQYCNPNEDYTDEETGQTLKGNSGLPERADALLYDDCINLIADKYKSYGVTNTKLKLYINAGTIPFDKTDDEDMI